MLSRLTIRNIYSHEETVFNFCEGLNVLIGDSQAGKTVLARALLLLANNRPLGADFFSDFAGDKGTSEVILETTEGNRIEIRKKVRVKEDGEKVLQGTEYRLNGGEPFIGMNKDVPDEIRKAINMTELNIQDQLVPPFLITSSPAEIARVINRITKFEQVDEWVSLLTKWVNASSRDIKRLNEELEEITNIVGVYDDLGETEQLVLKVEKLTDQIDEVEEEYSQIDSLVNDIVELEKKLPDREKLNEAEKLLSKAGKLNIAIDAVVKDLDNLQGCVSDIETIDSNLKSTRLTLKRERRQLEDLYKKLGVCPFCFSKITDDRLKKIMKEIY